MDQFSDVALGVVCGLASGAVMRRAYDGAFNWACRLPGPVRPVELNVPAGRVASRTATRFLLGGVCGCVAATLVVLLPVFAARSASSEWRHFLIGWLSGFIAAALTAAIVHRRDA